MRILLSTVAAAALMSAPALAQTSGSDIGTNYEQQQFQGATAPGAEAAARAGGTGGLQHELSDAGFHDAQLMRNAEVFHSTYQGQPAIVVLLEEGTGVGLGAGLSDSATDMDADVTGSVDEEFGASTGQDQLGSAGQGLGLEAPNSMDQQFGAAEADTLGEREDFDAADRDLGPDTTGTADLSPGADGIESSEFEAAGQGADIETDRADDQQLGAADTGLNGEGQQFGAAEEDLDPGTTGTIGERQADVGASGAEQPGAAADAVGGEFQYEQELGQAGFHQLRQAQGGEVIRSTTEDGRTMLIIVAQDLGGSGAETGTGLGAGDSQTPR